MPACLPAAAAELSGTLPDMFSSLTYLVSLNVADNYLTGTPPLLCSIEVWAVCVVHWATGATIDLSFNRFSGVVNMSLCFYIRELDATVSTHKKNMHTHTCTNMHIHMHTHTLAHTDYARMHAHVHTHAHTHTHTHTHTYTCTHAGRQAGRHAGCPPY